MQPSIHARHLLWCLAGLLAMFIGAVVGGMALGLYIQTPGASTVGVSLGGALLGVTVLLCGLGAKCG